MNSPSWLCFGRGVVSAGSHPIRSYMQGSIPAVLCHWWLVVTWRAVTYHVALWEASLPGNSLMRLSLPHSKTPKNICAPKTAALFFHVLVLLIPRHRKACLHCWHWPTCDINLYNRKIICNKCWYSDILFTGDTSSSWSGVGGMCVWEILWRWFAMRSSLQTSCSCTHQTRTACVI